MKMVGLFRDIDPDGIGPAAPSIRNAVDGVSQGAADAVAAYLETGFRIYDIAGVSLDPLDPPNHAVGGPSIYSDGIWIWREDFPYFMKKYRLAVPDEFLLHAVKWRRRPDRAAMLKNKKAIWEAIWWMQNNPSPDFRIPTVCRD